MKVNSFKYVFFSYWQFAHLTHIGRIVGSVDTAGLSSVTGHLIVGSVSMVAPLVIKETIVKQVMLHLIDLSK